MYKKKYDFKGGLKCLSKKNTVNNFLSVSFPLSEKFFIFIKNNYDDIKLRVKINEKVLRGQPLIFSNTTLAAVHAPTSGYIENIYFYSHPIHKYKKNIKIVIISDYLDRWIKLKPIKNYKQCTSEKLIHIIHQSGVVGLGGGEFPSAKKLMLSINKAHTLIVNAVESEPLITSDDCLINNYIPDILKGCEIISWISNIKKVLIAIQEDKTESILKISNCIKNKSLFQIRIIKKKYPGGSSKVLIKSLIGKEVPYNKHSIDIGYLIFNVATIYAIKRSIINGEPLTERIITLLDNKNFLSRNFWVRIGTPIKHLLTNHKLKKYPNTVIYSGGPFMGKIIYDLNYSILKKTNCISVQFQKEINKNIIEHACIRCSYCSYVCPVNLLPQQLYWYSKKRDHEKTQKYYILDCIECKACEKVCPSHIPLVRYFKKEKKILKKINLENSLKKISFLRFKKRVKRLSNQRNIIFQENIDNKPCYFVNKKNLNFSKTKENNINIKKKYKKRNSSSSNRAYKV